MSTLKFSDVSPPTVDVHYSNDVYLGQLQPTDDGFYVFWPELRGGCWAGYVLTEIAAKLDELNAPWEKMIDEYHAGDNSFSNLREATVAENAQNQKIRSTNTSGHPGVLWHSRDEI